ncbi:response regulator transcription factor [Kineosporia sp. J2-2]|uniref:Response regulator transcription factor n=1 Tax=Kineosporia corallincola TaxID=2835133 RepID=A0ABS5THH1_9ACTN|nr:hypothetical protein [Kineosporia corallincola]MBT0769498.1 response regulator transcription factor [Kineosporia corallincola]
MSATEGFVASGNHPYHQCRTQFQTRPGPGLADLVVIVGLSGMYAHGLCTALAESGLPCCCVPAAGELSQVVEAADSVLVVVPQELVGDIVAQVPRGRRPAVRLALLLADRDPRSYARALHLGAVGLVPLESELPDLIHVLSSAQRNRTVLPVDVVRALARSVSAVGTELSEAERAWLTELAGGRTVGDLARRSSYSEREMYRVLARLYRRLGATNRAAALIAAQRAGLLT